VIEYIAGMEAKMKKWGLLVAVLYGLVMFFSFAPIMKIAYLGTASWKDYTWGPSLSSADLLWVLVFFALLVIAQAALLAVPVRIAEKRPVGKRSLLFTAIASALMMGLLVGGVGLVLLEIFWGDKTGSLWANIFGWFIAAAFILTWVFWGFVFYRWGKKLEPANFIEKLFYRLFGGSILELLIAVPSHIFVRQRTYCCAGMDTSIGIICGVAVMLFSFGPGVFFLFVARWERLHPQK
jgi:hypothetical protein